MYTKITIEDKFFEEVEIFLRININKLRWECHIPHDNVQIYMPVYVKRMFFRWLLEKYGFFDFNYAIDNGVDMYMCGRFIDNYQNTIVISIEDILLFPDAEPAILQVPTKTNNNPLKPF